MRHTRLAALLVVLLALPVLAFDLMSPSTWFGRDAVTSLGRHHDQSHDVTSNGVTKVQMQYLYKEDWLVTDVDLGQAGNGITNLVAGQNVVVEDVGADGRTKRISALGGGGVSNTYTRAEVDDMTNMILSAGAALSGRVATNWTDIVRLKLTDLHLTCSNNIALARIENLHTNLNLTTASVSDLADRVPFRAPTSAYASFASAYPTVRVTTENGIGFYVRGTDGLYYDSRELTRRMVTPEFDVRTLYGRTFTPEYLSSNISSAVWESGFTLSAANIGSRLTDVCTVTGYPYVYGEAATVRDLVYNLLALDRGLWLDETGVQGHERDFMDLSGLRALALRGTVYAMRAHESVAQLRYDTRFEDGNAAFRAGVLSVIPASDFTPRNTTLVSTVDSRLSPTNPAFASSVAEVASQTEASVDAKLAGKLATSGDGFYFRWSENRSFIDTDAFIYSHDGDFVILEPDGDEWHSLSKKANRPVDFDSSHVGNIAVLDENGNLSDSGIPKVIKTSYFSSEFLPITLNGEQIDDYELNDDGTSYKFLIIRGENYAAFDRESGICEGGNPGLKFNGFEVVQGVYPRLSDSTIARTSDLTNKADRSMISATNPTFSNEVNAVAARLVRDAVSGLGADATPGQIVNALKSIGD